jgi:hypothetical protein
MLKSLQIRFPVPARWLEIIPQRRNISHSEDPALAPGQPRTSSE